MLVRWSEVRFENIRHLLDRAALEVGGVRIDLRAEVRKVEGPSAVEVFVF